MKLRVGVGIPAYNAEKNIGSLLDALKVQKQSYCKVSCICVYSDASTDATCSVIRKHHDKRIKIIEGKKRLGFAHGVKRLLHELPFDVVVLINDDVVIRSKDFVDNVVYPFTQNDSLGLACVRLQPLPPQNWIDNAASSGFYAFRNMAENYNNSKNVFTCDGKLLALSKKFIKSIKFPSTNSLMGNVDNFFYFHCLINGYSYQYIKTAELYFKCPSTISDFVSWQIRNEKNKYLFIRIFGKQIEKHYEMPKMLFTRYRIEEFIRNPFGAFVIYILGLYTRQKAKNEKGNFSEVWKLVNTTKKIKHSDYIS